MITGVSYMGHHNPRHLAADLAAMRTLGLDDLFLYIWAWEGQLGTTESCDNPTRAWAAAVEVIHRAQLTG
jgi:hypothetical protein